jgi:integrase
MVEGQVRRDGPSFRLRHDGRVRRRDPPQQVKLLIGQGAAGRVVPELETLTVDLADALRQLKPDVAWQGVRLEGAILRDYLRGPHRPSGELLFPSLATGREAILTDTRKLIDHVAIRAGFWEYVVTPAGEQVKNKAGQPKKRGTVRTKALRHSYCAARLQTLDGGAPVSIYTLSRELGHTSPAMVQRVYAHLGTIRHRAEVVEYRVDSTPRRLAIA